MSGGAQYGSIIVDICDPDNDGGCDSVRGGGSDCSILTNQDEMILRSNLVIQ